MFSVVYCTCPDSDTAAKISDALLNERMVACINSMSVTSRYWWKDQIESADEVLLIMKTRSSLVLDITRKVQELHPYDVPEVIAHPIKDGHLPYLEWIAESTE